MCATLHDENMQDPEFRSLFRQEKLLLDIQCLLVFEMERQGVTKADMARRMNMTRGYMTMVLGGEPCNLELRTAAKFFTALGLELVVECREGD